MENIIKYSFGDEIRRIEFSEGINGWIVAIHAQMKNVPKLTVVEVAYSEEFPKGMDLSKVMPNNFTHKYTYGEDLYALARSVMAKNGV